MKRLAIAIAVAAFVAGAGLAHAATVTTETNPAYSATQFVGAGPAINCPAKHGCTVTRSVDTLAFTTPSVNGHSPAITVTLNFEYKTAAAGYYYVGLEAYGDNGDIVNWRPQRRRLGVSKTITTTTLMYTFWVAPNTRYVLHIDPAVERATNTTPLNLDIDNLLVQVTFA